MKYRLLIITFLTLSFYMSAKGQQPDLIESGALREDREKYTEYHGAPRLSAQEINHYRDCLLKYATERLKRSEEGEIAQTLKLEWQYSGESYSRPHKEGKLVSLIYTAGNATVLVYNDVVMMQWLIENRSETTRRKYILIVDRALDKGEVRQIVLEE